jgi:uncharacterized protein (TIGR03083 family)
MATDEELVDVLDEVWAGIDALGAKLSETEWKQPTDCPGWSVQDNLVHISTVELMLLGRPVATVEVSDGLPHVKNDIGKSNERAVESRRAWRGADALAEFHTVTRERIQILRTLDEAGFGADSWTPVGPGTVRDLLRFRVFDAWVHGQDMRRAVDRPGDLDSPPAELALAMMLDAMPYVIGKKAGVPGGSTVVLVLTGPLARTAAIGVVDGRARLLDEPVDEPSVSITMETETFERLACGRLEPAEALTAGQAAIAGDRELGGRILDELNYLF